MIGPQVKNDNGSRIFSTYFASSFKLAKMISVSTLTKIDIGITDLLRKMKESQRETFHRVSTQHLYVTV
jgi:hypothetical protein